MLLTAGLPHSRLPLSHVVIAIIAFSLCISCLLTSIMFSLSSYPAYRICLSLYMSRTSHILHSCCLTLSLSCCLFSASFPLEKEGRKKEENKQNKKTGGREREEATSKQKQKAKSKHEKRKKQHEQADKKTRRKEKDRKKEGIILMMKEGRGKSCHVVASHSHIPEPATTLPSLTFGTWHGVLLSLRGSHVSTYSILT